MARYLFGALALTLVTSTAQAQSAPPVKPKLIVAISVDQFSSELFQRYRPTYVHGLKTISSGVAFPVGYQSHAATETCPGHSTILTGRHPSGTGIVANSWFDVKTGSNVYCVLAPGSSDANARGPQNMRVTTFGDWVKAAQPGSRSYAVSGKDRAAITMGGKHPDGVYWWVDGTGFTTSEFAGPATPATTEPVRAFDKALFENWKKTPPPLWPVASSQCTALQKPHRFGNIDLSGKVPPEIASHVEESPDFLTTTDFQENLRASPLFDSTVVDFARDLIARHNLGRGPATDVLAISLSATDYVGHRYGNGGAEMCVQQAALDASIGRLLDGLQHTGVPFVVVLTADHGATDAAEREVEHDPAATRIDDSALVGRLNKAIAAQLGIAYEPIVGNDAQQLYINVGPDAALRAKVSDATIAWLKQQPEVREVFTRKEVEAATVPPHTTPDKLTMVQRYHESYDPDRSGDIAVAYAARTSFGIPRGPGDTVAGHGSPWDHDRQVPILFWWPGATAETRATPVETVDIAPTLAALAKVPTPMVDGQCINLSASGTNCP
ncbi:alkaline phosphatase family protein [Sphingomonas paeninsulae]|uniref:Alkaline phosphatase n=1 Tax=Sphingomonas paeninsulae TaxID=2319844 RepID=A0A494TK37_SPHPE|nr:alkaline phosphatase family protein [Sphingomonas paeninsulae]AYJ87413.1 alkaline phosphatase family protein [Sphingomonas paeninsulae]